MPRGSLPPSPLVGYQPRFSPLAFQQLLHHFGVGGARWICQFVPGSPAVWSFSQAGVFPLSDMYPCPAPVSAIWRPSVRRFRERAGAAGFRLSQELWDEAMEQVASGFLSDALPFKDEWGRIFRFLRDFGRRIPL